MASLTFFLPDLRTEQLVIDLLEVRPNSRLTPYPIKLGRQVTLSTEQLDVSVPN